VRACVCDKRVVASSQDFPLLELSFVEQIPHMIRRDIRFFSLPPMQTTKYRCNNGMHFPMENFCLQRLASSILNFPSKSNHSVIQSEFAASIV